MRHVFKLTGMGWEPTREGVWFDADIYTKEAAEEQFVPVQKISRDGWPYTAYEYEGETYRYVQYLGLFENDDMPKDDADFFDKMLKKDHFE